MSTWQSVVPKHSFLLWARFEALKRFDSFGSAPKILKLINKMIFRLEIKWSKYVKEVIDPELLTKTNPGQNLCKEPLAWVQAEKRVAHRTPPIIGKPSLRSLIQKISLSDLTWQRQAVLPVLLPHWDKQGTRWPGIRAPLVFALPAEKIASGAHRSMSWASPASELTFHFCPSAFDLGNLGWWLFSCQWLAFLLLFSLISL